jgi:amino acid adenylation domain-containing protein
VDDMKERIANLSPEKRALLERSLQQRVGKRSSELTISLRKSDGPARLSFAQQRLWFLNQMEPDSPVYNISKAFRVTGQLDIEVVQTTLDEIVSRHESLRSTIGMNAGVPLQTINPPTPVELNVVDLSTAPEADRESRLDAILVAESRRPFDLTTDLMLQAALVRLGEEDHVLLFVVHHIASDGWSSGVLIKEFSALYEAAVTHAAPTVAELPVQYADYAEWQLKTLTGEKLDSQVRYWKERLDGASPTLELPLDHARRAARSDRGAHHSVTIPRTLTDSVEAMSVQAGATLFTSLLTAFQTLLYRYSGEVDIGVGSLVAGRMQVETEPMIGFFVNTLVMRTDLSGNPVFTDLLARVRENTMGALSHQELPFEKLVEELHPERATSHTPLFQVVFALQNTPGASLTLPGATAIPIDIDNGTSKFDLTMSLTNTQAGLTGFLEFSTDVFEASTTRRLVDQFEVLLESIVASPDNRIDELPLLRESEHKQIIEIWNDTTTRYPNDRGVHRVFEEKVESTPDAPAVSLEGESLTYRELNERANQVAHRLQALGVRRGDLVGICMTRCPDLIVATIAVLKVGAAYVPLSTTDPAERLTFMLHDTKISVVIAQRQVFQELQHQVANVVWIDSDRDSIQRLEPSNPDVSVFGEDPAYVMYTSGSTGQPKGVVVPHRAIARLVCNTDYIDLGPSDCVAQVSNATFDAVTFEVWGALLNGARLDIIPQEVVLSPQEFSKRLRDDGITALFMTTAFFNQLIQEVPDIFGTLRHLMFGGEMADARRVRQLLSTNPPERLLHVYGPTESTTYATWHLVEHVPADAKTVPIGRPIANTTVYVLDRNMQPVPVGLPGEIYIGGDGLALEYWDRPELTQEKFVSNPFSADLNAKLYRTGDRAKYLSDGSIEFLRRADDQVKIRGFRVEPGEIENALNEHPAVRASVVLAHSYREEARGGAEGAIERLVAYVVPEQATPDVADLRRFLQEMVPDYMVPSAFVPLDELPVNSNGKVDKRALPTPDAAQFERSGTFVEPTEEVHWHLRDLWAGVLNVPSKAISLDDNFFELGGHSLLAVSLLAQVNQLFDKNLTVATLFETPTILELAEVIKRQGWQAASSSLIPIQPQGSKQPFFFVGGGLAMCYRLASLLGNDQPIYVLRGQQLSPDRLPFPQVKEVVAQYVHDIYETQPEGPYSLAGFSFEGVVALETARLIRKNDDDVPLVALMDTWRPGHRPESQPRGEETGNEERVTGDKGIIRRLRRTVGKPVYLLLDKFFRVSIYKAFQLIGRPVPIRLQDIDWVRHRALAMGIGYKNRLYPGRVTLFRAMERRRSIAADNLGWGSIAEGGVEIIEVPGNHITMIREPNLQVLVSRLAECLSRGDRSDESDSDTESVSDIVGTAGR